MAALAARRNMYYFARFEEIDGELFRFDTRIYLNSYDTTEESICVGAIVGKNPGSASPKELGKLLPLDLNNDKMLPTVRNRFRDGFKLADKEIPKNAFVRVWNLFYLCNKDLDAACKIASTYKSLPLCSTENEATPLVWYGWGGSDSRLNGFKERFLRSQFKQEFCYDHDLSVVAEGKPTQETFAKHTQGMPAKPVNEYLAKYCTNRS